MPTLTDKTILVTGASQGLGEQVAKAYAAEGATVILVARHQKKLEKAYDAIVEAGHPEPFAIRFDLMSAEEKEFERFAATIAEATQGKLDGIVHCAGLFLRPLAAGFPNRRRMGQPIPHQHRRPDGADPRPVPAAEAVARRVRHLRRRKPRRNTQSLLGRLRRVQSRVELPVQSRRRRMGTLRQPARQRPRPLPPSIPRNGSNPIRAKPEANAKATGTYCPHLSGGQVPKAKGGAAKSFTSKSGKGRHPARAALPF